MIVHKRSSWRLKLSVPAFHFLWKWLGLNFAEVVIEYNRDELRTIR